MSITSLWRRAFLEEQPSLSLGVFRFAVAFTVGAHVISSFFYLEDNFLSTAFKTKNVNFFPLPILRVVEASPDWIVYAFVALFLVSLVTFAFGLYSQASCVTMTACCYYFYALNNCHIGTLSYDILLVTLFLMCVTNYHGDFLSLDSLRRGDDQAYKRLRPYFLQRLLQLQMAWTFWGTALSKVTAGGNWIIGNPWYYLMHYPPLGVVREFPLRGFLAQHPGLCYGIGLGVLTMEITLPFLWFMRRTRIPAVLAGWVFHVLLLITLHVPTIFFFLFPPQVALFIEPERLVRWIEAHRARAAAGLRPKLLYDGHCGFCLASIARLRVLDLFGQLELLDFHVQPELKAIHPELTAERCHSEMALVEPDGRLSGGCYAFRRIARRLPLLWGIVPLVYLPGAGWVGTWIYRWIATHRYLLHRNPTCSTNQCSV